MLPFTQNGDVFLWPLAVADVAGTSVSSITPLTLASVPSGVQVTARVRVLVTAASSGSFLLNSLYENGTTGANVVPGNLTFVYTAGSAGAGVPVDILTNTSRQIEASYNNGSATVYVATYGWIDTRGRFN